MSQTLKNKRALVTGGSRGIGAGIVKRLASEGADVAFTYVSSPEKSAALAKEIEALGVKALAIQADSADATAVTTAVEKAAKELGGIDILVNSAGVGVFGTIDKLTVADYDKIMAVNVRAVFVATSAVLKYMPDGGRIINIGSCNAERMPFQGGSIYAMSKSALQGFVQGAARDLGKRGITINNVQPGPVDTDLNPKDGPNAAGLLNLMALTHFGTTSDIGALVAFLAGPEAGYITGASLTIDGGFNA